MALEAGAEFEELVGMERLAGEFVESVQDAESDGDAAAHATGARDSALDFPGERERGLAGGCEEGI